MQFYGTLVIKVHDSNCGCSTFLCFWESTLLNKVCYIVQSTKNIKYKQLIKWAGKVSARTGRLVRSNTMGLQKIGA